MTVAKVLLSCRPSPNKQMGPHNSAYIIQIVVFMSFVMLTLTEFCSNAWRYLPIIYSVEKRSLFEKLLNEGCFCTLVMK